MLARRLRSFTVQRSLQLGHKIPVLYTRLLATQKPRVALTRNQFPLYTPIRYYSSNTSSSSSQPHVHEIHPDEIGFGYGFSNDNPAEQIFLAASNGEIQTVVKDFEKFKNARDEWGNSLIHVAAMYGQASLITQLCMLGARVNDTNNNKQTPLFLACYTSEVNSVLALSGLGATIDFKDIHGRTPLIYSLHSSSETLTTLMKLGANIHETTNSGATPLFYFKNEPNGAINAKTLLEAGAKITVKDNKGRSAVHMVKSPEVVELLVKAGADVNEKDNEKKTPMHYAAEGHPEMIEKLASLGAKVNERSSDPWRETPLEHAISVSDVKSIEALAKAGADFKMINNRGMSLLHYALTQREKTEEIMKSLIHFGAPLNVQDSYGTPLMHAVASPFTPKSIVNLLVSSGADINAKGKDDHTAIHFATKVGNKEMVEELLKLGARIDMKTAAEKKTPLIIATELVFNNIIEVLVKHGANVNEQFINGWTPLHVASLIHYPEFQRINRERAQKGLTPLTRIPSTTAPTSIPTLLKLDAKVDILDNSGSTALHLAYYHGNLGAAKELREGGASVDIRNREGLTPLDVQQNNAEK